MLGLALCTQQALAADPPWVADLGEGRYQNPVLFADYSDPDAIRVADTYYLTASSFNSAPGLPLLTSKDLVNWTLVGHALPRLVPEAHFRVPRHGEGVWAPCLRYHDGQFWIFYPDPDFGIYVITAARFEGPWSAPHLLLPGKGIIDPTPLWDDDGKAYLLHAWAKSRAGINNLLTLRRMSPDGRRLLDLQGQTVIDGNKLPGYRTLEGPKLYKHQGWYYVLAPAGGVEEGWQAVFRARSIEGPYEERIVLEQGDTPTNGPHQGAWVRAQDGSDWFLHFQDRQAYGRLVHLQPMAWQDGWPLMGQPGTRPGTGNPVPSWRKPVAGQPVVVPATGDEFEAPQLGLQWQWNANPGPAWYSLSERPGWLRLHTQAVPEARGQLRLAPNILSQKLPGPAFTVDVRLSVANATEGDRSGLVLNALSPAWLGLRRQGGQHQLVYASCVAAAGRCEEQAAVLLADAPPTVDLRLRVQAVKEGAQVQFFYSVQPGAVVPAAPAFTASKGRWVGAQMGLFSVGDTPGAGFADVDYFRVTH